MGQFSIIKSRTQAKTLMVRRLSGNTRDGKQGLLAKVLDGIEKDLDSTDDLVKTNARNSVIKLLPYCMEKMGRESENNLAKSIEGGKTITFNFHQYLEERRGAIDTEAVILDDTLKEITQTKDKNDEAQEE